MTSPFDEFAGIQTAYFPMLDLRVSSTQRTAIPQFAARVSLIADNVRDLGDIQNPTQRSVAGLIFIYDALMTLNNTDAALDGKLTLDVLKTARRFSAPGANDRDELMARAQYALSELDMAATLRPDDRRIDSWRVSVRTNMEKIRTGAVSGASLSPLLDTIDARPTFNLWTALLIFQTRDASTDLFGRLIDAAKTFVDSTNSGADPCSARPQDCQNGLRAPYNIQSAVTVLGDVFLRRSNQLLRAGDVAAAMPLAYYAQGTYSQLRTPLQLPHTKTWPDRSALVVREESVRKLLNGEHFDDAALVESDDYQRAYDCSACHGRAAQ
jgi:hypothetical protein